MTVLTRRKYWYLAALAALIAGAATGPAGATWTYTSGSPLVFEFKDNDSGVFNDPWVYEIPPPPVSYSTCAEAPNAGVCFNYCDPREDNAGWVHTFSPDYASGDGLGSLAIQSNADQGGRSMVWCTSDYGGFSINTLGKELNWTNGIEMKIKAKTVGDKDGVTRVPPGWTWGSSYSLGGAEFHFLNLVPSDGSRCGLMLSWATNDAADAEGNVKTDDDYVSVRRFDRYELAGVQHSLGGAPTAPPEHVYRLTARKSPLPLTPTNDLVLVNVYVDSDWVIQNRTVSTHGDAPYDKLTLGAREYTSPHGNIYDYLKIWEADAIVDTDAPTPPSNLQGESPECHSVTLTWTAGTDPGGAVIGYHIECDSVEVGYSDTTTYTATGFEGSTTHSFRVHTVDQKGNASGWFGPIEVATQSCFTGPKLTFDFDDRSPGFYNPVGTFWTRAEESDNFWFGRRNTGQPTDGTVYWESQNYPTAFYRYTFARTGTNCGTGATYNPACDGSMTVQTRCSKDLENTGRTMIDTNDFGLWFRWQEEPLQGMKVTADVNLLGDFYGWCVAYGAFPAIGTCNNLTNGHGHQASDWGVPGAGLSGVLLSVDDAIGGNGAQCWVSVSAGGDLRDPTDDRIYVRTQAHEGVADFQFRDGLGLGLTPEDGTIGNPPCGRDGTIKCWNYNHLVVEFGVVPAGGEDEYWDIWITRPDGTKIHLNPATCECSTGLADPPGYPSKPEFGSGGHTMKFNYNDRDQLGSRLRLGNQVYGQVWGVRYNNVKICNDWDGASVSHISTLGELRKVEFGSQVEFDATGGEKIVTTNITTSDYERWFFYIEQADRSEGIRISASPYSFAWPITPIKGNQVTHLFGVLLRDADGNPYIDVSEANWENPYGQVTFDTTTTVVTPLGMTNRSVAGSAAADGSGLDNVGILATVWGKVLETGVDSTGNRWALLDDGSGTPVKVLDLWYDELSSEVPVVNQFWMATGPVALEKDTSGDYVRSLIVEGANMQRIVP